MTTLNKDLAAIQLQEVIEQLKQFDTSGLIETYNDYADKNSYESIYHNNEDTINCLFYNAWTAISLSNHDGYKDNDDYFSYNGYGLMSSFNYITDDNCPIDISELAQWLIDEDKLGDYDITVTTLDDILASIEDNITDDNVMLSKLADYLGQSLNSEQVEQLKTDDEYYDYLVSHFINELDDYSYNDLNELINTVGINYSVN